MSKLLNLYDWLNIPESIAYLKDKVGIVDAQQLVRAYLKAGNELKFLPYDVLIQFFSPEDNESANVGLEPDGFVLSSFYGREFIIHVENADDIRFEKTLVFVKKDKSLMGGKRSEPEVIFFNRKTDESSFRDLLFWGDIFTLFPLSILLSKQGVDSLVSNLEEFDNSQSQEASKRSLGSKERNTLLVVIAALCKEMEVDWSQRGVATAIQRATETLGAPVSDDTIRKIFIQIDSALESRQK